MDEIQGLRMVCRNAACVPRIDITISEIAWHDAFAWMAQINLMLLQQFQAAPRNGHPAGMTAQEWEASLAKMVEAFTLLTQEGEGISLTATDIEKVNEGLREFAAHFRDLWD